MSAMPYQVLARKYRPLRFGDVVGQDHVTRTLQNALEQNRIAHGYIFSGHRGIGKTTIARILASALNCRRTIGSVERPTPEPCLTCDSCLEIRQGNAVDVIEIDAATNRGIDEIRELRDAARYRPARDRFKIYILDEAHQITDAAFNALLKTLEEPPDHIVFMMATTEPENIPQTIRSRCQHFSFHAVKLDDILGQLRKIADDEGVLADAGALDLLAEAGDGSMRDALSIMDQAIASAPVNGGKPELSATEIRELMGSMPNTVFEEMLEHVSENSAAGVLTTANRLLDAGNSPAQIARQFARYLRNCVVAKIAAITPDAPDTELLQISPDERRRAARSALLFTEEELTRFLQVILRTFDDLGFRQEQRFHLELGLLKLVHLQRLLPMEHFLSQLPRPAGSARKPAPRRTTVVASSSAVSSVRDSVQDPRPSSTSTGPERTWTAATPATAAASAPREAESAAMVAAVSVPPVSDSSAAPGAAYSPTDSSFRPERSEVEESASFSEVAPAFPEVATPSAEPPRSLIFEPLTGTPTVPPGTNRPPNQETTTTPDLSVLQTAAVEALFGAKTHNSAAEQLEQTTWTLTDDELQIQTGLSKQLLATIFRADVEAILKGVLRAQGLTGTRISILPGTPDSKPKAPKKPRTGSAQAKALEHPTVQAAQRLFNAEITNVFDLRRD